MQRALALAQAVIHLTSPNPRVGCVLCDASGTVIGEGATQAVGGPHAEIMALRDAKAKGHPTQGATAYVSLEPCAHTGRTGPCCEALVAAGIAQVHVATTDPNPLVAGKGLAYLRAHGIGVTLGDGQAQAAELNIGFFSRMKRQRPWVRLKIAASLDGQIALQNGLSQWITSEAARHDGHLWRARACALLTGAGTVHSDNPRLDVRGVDTPRQPRLVLVDSRLDVPPSAQVFAAQREQWVYCAQAAAERVAALASPLRSVMPLPNAQGKVDLAAMMDDLAQRQINELHVEAGSALNGSLLRENLVDELLVYLAPKWLGHGLGMSQFGPLAQLTDAPQLVFESVDRVGPDLRVLARFQGRADFLTQI